jgi:hypothetical protein
LNEPRARSAAFRAGGRIVLTGAALDDRHRELRGRALTWYAGRTRLGLGRKLTVRLPAGRPVLHSWRATRAGAAASRGCGCASGARRTYPRSSPAARAG